VQVPGLHRVQYTHTGEPGNQPARLHMIEVHTDADITGRMAPISITPEQAEILRRHVIGEDPFQRERLFQMLHKGTRWIYQSPGWFGEFDSCLWYIAGRFAGLPIHALIGRMRERFPAYLTGGNMDTAGYPAHIESGRDYGVTACKFHSYSGGKADSPIHHTVRRELGNDYTLISDPVCSYDLREAIEVGRVMEELGFVWLEVPFHEQNMNQYHELCRVLTMPMIATECVFHDMELTAQWLLQGATDRLRARATFGLTQVLKLAELHDTNVELNGQSGLFGLVHAHVDCCIDNTDYYEYFGMGNTNNRQQGEIWGLLNAPLIEDGYIAPPEKPGWGAVWDEERVRKLTVKVC